MQDYDTFYREEMGYRRVGLYPPYCDLCCVVFSHEDEKTAARAAGRFREIFVEQAGGQPSLPLRLIGPTEGSPYRAAGRYRCRILIKCRNNRAFRGFLQSVIDRFADGEKEVFPAVDCYYDSNI
jgi:primosomal protein N' (replication factor Y)